MESFLRELATILQGIHLQTFFERNRSAKIIYPYATYSFDSEAVQRNRDGFYIDIDLFDRSDTSSGLMLLEDRFKDGLIFNRTMTNDLYLRFEFSGSNKIPTGDDHLKRRNVRFYATADWRKKEYGTK